MTTPDDRKLIAQDLARIVLQHIPIYGPLIDKMLFGALTEKRLKRIERLLTQALINIDPSEIDHEKLESEASQVGLVSLLNHAKDEFDEGKSSAYQRMIEILFKSGHGEPEKYSVFHHWLDVLSNITPYEWYVLNIAIDSLLEDPNDIRMGTRSVHPEELMHLCEKESEYPMPGFTTLDEIMEGIYSLVQKGLLTGERTMDSPNLVEITISRKGFRLINYVRWEKLPPGSF